MSTDRRFEQELPGLLEDLYIGPMPAYRDRILQQTARTRQRPAWSTPERWLPVVDIARQPVLAPRLPWRAIGLGLVLVALLAAMAAALVAGARPNLPKPFGPARNGLVAYASGGHIYTIDPVTGSSTAIVSGPETDINPRWSRDGTRLALERKIDGDPGPGLIYVVRRDGSDPIRITPDPLPVIEDYSFSPDGKQILISTRDQLGYPRVLIAATNGREIHQLDVGMPPTGAAWRPDGSEILFMDSGSYAGIYGLNVDSGKVRTILPRAVRYREDPRWSPDGSLISYIEWDYTDGPSAQTHIIGADGIGDRILPVPAGAVWQAALSWSNDGTRLLADRGYTVGFDHVQPVVIPIEGSGPGTVIPYSGYIGAAEWAPDDSWILASPVDDTGALLGQLVLDPRAGTVRTPPWESVSEPSVQRLAP